MRSPTLYTCFFTLLVTCLLVVAPRAFGFVVQDIQVEGLQRVSSSPVFAALPIRVGQDITEEDIADIIEEVFATGFFKDVSVFKNGSTLLIRVVERATIKSIEIDGNKAIKTEQLEEVLRDNGVAEGEIFQVKTLTQLNRELEKQYVAQSRYASSVDAQVTELANNMVSVEINIDEGKPASIEHINIVGNKIFSDEVLLDKFELGTKDWWKLFTSKNKYAKERLEGDLETLQSYYFDRGYLDFEVLSTQVSINEDKKHVYITVNVKEGNQYRVEEVDLAGDLIVPEQQIRRLINLRKGDVFSQQIMTATAEYITTLLANAGYTNAKVEGQTDKDPETNKVDVTFFMDPSERVYVRRINFKGNVRTNDDVLRREMRQLEGASASKARIEQSKVRLERLGFFKSVEVDEQEVPGNPDQIDITYNVEEQSSGQLSASIGYAQTTGLNYGFSVQQNNWLGTGNRLAFNLSDNIYQSTYSLSYTDPYFTADGVSRGIDLYYRVRDYDRINVARYATDTYGGRVTFGYPISEVSRLSFGVGLQHQEIRAGFLAPQQVIGTPRFSQLGDGVAGYITESELAQANEVISYFSQDPIEGEAPEAFDIELRSLDLTESEESALTGYEPGFLDLFGSEFTTGSLSASWSRITLNRGVLATRGASHKLNFEVTVPGSELEYYKATYDGQVYKHLFGDFTLRFKSTIGYGAGYEDTKELPFFENFYAGGFGSVRGFERSTLGPKPASARQFLVENAFSTYNGVDAPELQSVLVLCEEAIDDICDAGQLSSQNLQNVENRSRRDAIGGSILFEFSTELLLPIPFIEDSRSMQLAAFVDAGNVFSDSCRSGSVDCHDFDLDELSSAYGLGFTWISGFGPLTFSLAKPIKQGELDRRETFQFSFGTGF